MKKLLGLLIVLSFVLTLAPAAVFAGGPDVYPLMAGQNIEVGTVTVSDDGTDLTVHYGITEAGWFIVQAHMYADVKAPKNGAPGRFPFDSGPVHGTSFTFTVPLADLGVASGDELFIAAHAVVNNEFNTIGYMDAEGVIHDAPGFDIVGYVDNEGVVHPEPGFDIVGYIDNEGVVHPESGLDIVGYIDNEGVVHPEQGSDIVGYTDSNGVFHEEPGFDTDCPTLADIEAALPNTVFQTWTQAGEGYFQTTISGGTNLDGTYTSWCIDHDHRAVRNTDANVYSSYEPLPDSLTTAYEQPREVGGPNSNIDKPENLDLLNWLINNTQRPLDQQVSATNTGGSLQVPVSTDFFNAGLSVASTKFETTTTTGPNVQSFDGTLEQIVLDSTAGLVDGDRVRVSANFGGLKATTTYWVRVLDGTTVSLFNSYARAVNTVSNDGLRGLNDSYPLVAGTTLDTEDADNETVTFTTDPGWVTGTAVKVSATGGGLNAGTNYYVRNLGGGKYSFYSSEARATDSDGGDPLGGRRNLTADIAAIVYIIVKDAAYLASADDTVTFASGHGFVTGSQVYVTADGFGLDASRLYRLYNVSGDTFSFHTNNPSATNKVDLLGDVQPSGVYLSTDDTVTVPAYSWATGMRVQVSQDGGGLTAGVDYYIRAINSTTLAFYATAADASNNVNRIDLTGAVDPALISSWYADGVVQAAIWNLIDDNPPSCNASCQELVASASANDGFVPDIAAGEQVAIILQPVDLEDETQGQVTIGQVTIIDLGLECTETPWTPVEEPWAPVEEPWAPVEEPWTPVEEPWTPVYQSETGWAIADGGIPFKGKGGWGSYFAYPL
jgi:hypothetical protein